jgi:drug/metabolite transporter (DMT)-like permease
MSKVRIIILTSLAMIAFAGNSLLCRIALRQSGMDAASFTTIRLVSGAVLLWLIVRIRHPSKPSGSGNWLSAIALFIYAAGFSFAYTSLPAASGALLLFGAVQITMISYGLWFGERLGILQLLGFVLAFGGLIGLLLPGLSAPPLIGSLLMMGAGIAWGIYSLRGRGAGDPTSVTAGNFMRAAVISAAMSLALYNDASINNDGVWFAIASGALASGIGYSIWYTALPGLKATNAATAQLSVPVIAALGGIVFLGEPLSMRLIGATIAILGGIALVILEKRNPNGN